MKLRIAAVAASRRVGSTSRALIEPDTSTRRITVECREIVVKVALGRAVAAAAHVSASKKSATGTQRRHDRLGVASAASRSRFVNTTALRTGRLRTCTTQASSAGTIRRKSRKNGEPKLM